MSKDTKNFSLEDFKSHAKVIYSKEQLASLAGGLFGGEFKKKNDDSDSPIDTPPPPPPPAL
jgi:hypothetical protein